MISVIGAMIQAAGHLLDSAFIWFLIVLAAGAVTFAFIDSRKTTSQEES